MDREPRGIGSVRIQQLTSQEPRDPLPRPDVFDRRCVSRRNIHDAKLPPLAGVLDDRGTIDQTKANDRLALDDEKLLHLGLVIMMTPRDARFRPRHEDLSE